MSQTTLEEREALSRYAKGCRTAVEIGTYQGVSSIGMAKALAPGGMLWCVDPWPDVGGKANPLWSICERHFKRSGIQNRITIVRDFSINADSKLPMSVDFAFIDGDHSWDGIEVDWKLLAPRIGPLKYICLHDSVVPANEQWRSSLESNRYYSEVIARDERFELVECVHSMVVLRRLP